MLRKLLVLVAALALSTPLLCQTQATLPPEKTVFDSDTEFATGSRIAVTQLSKTQIDNLVTLGKVWGFLKYHHPAVTSGKHQWDFELFRVLPAVLAASDRNTANAAMLKWIQALGPVQPCNPCAKLDRLKLHFAPDLDWISDQQLLGPGLSRELQSIYANRSTGSQFYVSLVPEVLNAHFEHEHPYLNLTLPDFGFQLLGVYRFWNAVEYWSPYRNIIGEDWNAVLARSIQSAGLAKDADSYTREFFKLTASLHDGHSSLWNSIDLRPPVGKCQLPVNVRMVENQPVVTNLAPGVTTDLKVGDVIAERDGASTAQLTKDWLPYYSGSNDVASTRDIGRFLTRGACGPTTIKVRRAKQELQLSVARVALTAPMPGMMTHDLSGETFRLLSKDVAYLKLSSVNAGKAGNYLEQAQGTKGWIIDIRNYPSDFMVFDLGSHLVKERTDFATFTNGDLANPGAFFWGHTEAIQPAFPHYEGKVIILVDEVTMSSAEYTSMAFRSVPGAIVVGSTTSGADGNISGIALPFGLRTVISGIGVFYPDRKPTQQIGIVPDLVVKPTIAGITAGRDEVLEEALRQILGAKTSPEELQKLAR
jgi:C-terminal processing protease CtpA/Prc